jgi:hypothetical protein
MSRRICLAFLVASFALGAPTASLAQSSSQAQYQGVAPETQVPSAGGGNGTAGSGGSGVSGTGVTSSGATKSSGGGGKSAAGSANSGATGNGGSTGTATGSSGSQPAPAIAAPSASRATTPFSGGDIALIVLACAGMVGLGIVLRRTTRRDPAGA